MAASRRRAQLLVFAAIVVLASVASVPAQAITNGQADSAGAWGNVGVFLVMAPDGQVFPFCSGTLVSPDVFLTAAHCTERFNEVLVPYGYEAYASFDTSIPFGELTDPATQLFSVSAVVTNPGYSQAQSDSGDLGALVLSAPVQSILPATLPACGLLDDLAGRHGLKGAVFTAVGYGLQDRVVGGGVPTFGDENPIPRMFAYSVFSALNPSYVRLSQNPALGNGGTCFGDSGGPEFLLVGGQVLLVAVSSTGDSACRATNVGYRMDTPEALSFLSFVNEAYGTSIPVAACP